MLITRASRILLYSLKCVGKYRNQRTVIILLQSTHVQPFFTSSNALKKHSTKRWKVIARGGESDNMHDISKGLSCEEGSDAVLHSTVVSHLQDCDSVANQITEFCSLLSISSEEVKHRKEFCEALNEVFRPYFSNVKVHHFGSTINGLGFKGCDLDICIQTLFQKEDYLKGVDEVPNLDSVLQGEVNFNHVDRLPPRFLLRFVRRILRRHFFDIKEPILLIKARCPILRFYNAKYDVYCDLTCENKQSLLNTKLIRLICHLDDRFPVITKFIRYWGKYGGFVGDIDLFNSYAFSLLVVHFLQSTDPPVLPPISEIIKYSDYLNHGEIDDDEILYKDLKKFSPSQNKQSSEELLRQYFFYFLDFDFSNMIIPLRSMVIPKRSFTLESPTDGKDVFEMSTITIQDPFRPYFNVTAGATFRCCKKFFNGLIQACNAYYTESFYVPGSNEWGLSSLFCEPISESELYKSWQKNGHVLRLPMKKNMTLIKDILEQLLFECTDFKLNKPSSSQTTLKIDCKVYSNTWQGRYWIYQKFKRVITDPLELEHAVSKEVIKGEVSRNVLFTFTCVCNEDILNKELIVSLLFSESKYPPSFSVFLKEFISSLYYKCKE